MMPDTPVCLNLLPVAVCEETHEEEWREVSFIVHLYNLGKL